jgi:phosphoglycolate phosphatase-like HAD superfamily hydrolase
VKPWDSYDAYLFDIDGTLLHCADSVHYFAFCDALSEVAGRPLNLDGVATQGNVDPAILRDAFTLASVDESIWRPRLAEACERMCAQVWQNRGDLHIDVLPGVRELLSRMRAAGKPLGVATGNLAGIGRLKLERCGLFECFAFGGYSDGLETREAVFAAAAAQARALAGAAASLCVFGDTPADVRAAKANGLDVVAVATGIFSCEELAQERPTLLVKTLPELLAE